jgi:DNA-binding transcriptional ArsR family regulator/uncharacterized protein YndB with AHSA1/START domain
MDAIFKALNDPARRDLLDSLRQKDGQSLGELETVLDMTRFGVMKHLRVLEDAHLITTVKKGRFKYHYLNALPLQEVIDRWIEPLLAKPAARAVIDLKKQLEGTARMPTATLKKPDFVMSTYIRCTQDALWDALTDAENIVHWHFMAARAEGDMKPGGASTYFAPDGNPFLTIKVTAETPKTRLDMGFHPAWAPGLAASSCAYLIEPGAEHCKLTVEHYDLPEGQEGAADGWQRMLSGLKTYLETGKPANFGYGG